jgi:hypothetical protein
MAGERSSGDIMSSDVTGRPQKQKFIKPQGGHVMADDPLVQRLQMLAQRVAALPPSEIKIVCSEALMSIANVVDLVLDADATRRRESVKS